MNTDRRITDGSSVYSPFDKVTGFTPLVTADTYVASTVVNTATGPYKKLEEFAVSIKHDSGKPDWSLVPFEALEEVVRVLEFGAKKYSRDNWRTGEGFKYSRVLSSLLRHIYSYLRGEDNDPESGLSHMAHAGCNVLFILYYIKNKSRYKNDDRYVP